MPNSDQLINQWDVVVLPFPYADQFAEKRRPALVVSSQEFNNDTGLLWVLMITTSAENWLWDLEIEDIDACGLPAPSKIRCAKIATIEAKRVLRIAGQLAGKQQSEVQKLLKQIF